MIIFEVSGFCVFVFCGFKTYVNNNNIKVFFVIETPYV
jgi:hypothetical protein